MIKEANKKYANVKIGQLELKRKLVWPHLPYRMK